MTAARKRRSATNNISYIIIPGAEVAVTCHRTVDIRNPCQILFDMCGIDTMSCVNEYDISQRLSIASTGHVSVVYTSQLTVEIIHFIW